MKKSYDPGTVGTIEKIGKGAYLVESFRNRNNFYQVNLNSGICTCPAFAKSGHCKHQDAVEDMLYRKSVEVAKSMSEDELRKQALRSDLPSYARRAVEEIKSRRYLASIDGFQWK